MLHEKSLIFRSMQFTPKGVSLARAIDITQYYHISKSVGNNVKDRARIISIRTDITKDSVISITFLLLYLLIKHLVT